MKKTFLIGLTSLLFVACGNKDIQQPLDTSVKIQGARGVNNWELITNNGGIAAVQPAGDNRISLTTTRIYTVAIEPSQPDIGSGDGHKPDPMPIPPAPTTYTYVGLKKLTLKKWNDDLVIQKKKSLGLSRSISKETAYYFAGAKSLLAYRSKYSELNIITAKAGSISKAFTGAIRGKPAIISHGSRRLAAFVWGENNRLWMKSSTDNGKTWKKWKSLGGTLKSSPTAVSPKPGHIDVYVRGDDDRLLTRSSTDNGKTWKKWKSLSGILQSGPSASVRNGKIDVVAFGVEGNLWRRTWSKGKWTNWIDLGAGPAGAITTKAPSVTSIDDFPNTIQVFAYAESDKSLHAIYSKSFSD